MKRSRPVSRALLAGTSLVAVAGLQLATRQAAADTTVFGSTAIPVDWTNTNLTITNTGTINSSSYGISVSATDGGTMTVYSGGRVSAGATAIKINSAANIGTIRNAGTLTVAPGSAGVLYNQGTIGTIDNTGSITTNGTKAAIYNLDGRIAVLSNSGVISSGSTGVNNAGSGSIGTLTNSGTITGAYGVWNGYSSGASTISNLTNTGTISGSGTALLNQSNGNIGVITNSGVIAGSIVNQSANALTIAGASGSSFGVLTGYNSGSASESNPGAVGSINSSTANLIFSAGNILLNDHINATGHTVSNTGATLKIQNTVTISGQYSQTGGGLVVVATGGGTSYGILSVTGNATISNTTITISGSGLSKGQSFTIVDSGGTGSYVNDTATVSGTSGLKATVSTSGNDLLVTLISSANYASLAQNAGGSASGLRVVLDNISQSSSAAAQAFQTEVLTKLDALSSTAQPAALKQLAPSQLTPAVQVVTQAVAPATAAIEQHQLQQASNGEVGMAAGSAGHDSALWGQVIGGNSSRGSTAGADGFHAWHVGLVGGFDHQATKDTMVGVAVSWLKGSSSGRDGASGSKTETDTYQITGYGLQRWDRFFVTGQLGLGLTNFDQSRSISFLGSTANADYDGWFGLVKTGFGYDIAARDGLTLTPLASLRYLHAMNDGYTETGAGAANLTIDRQTNSALTHEIGGKVSATMQTDWGSLTPEFRAAWVHDYRNGPISTSGLMGGEAFTSTVNGLSPDGARLNFAATLETDDNLSFRVEIETEIRPDYVSRTGLLQAKSQF